MTYVLEPLVIRWAVLLGIVDEPDWRKVHRRPVARGGGLAFFPGLAVTLIAAL
ncbi:MAG: hypothetical protein QG656_260, partial [Candidatus Hydrogenedentes bacterium]|nr:hypothetical protein [Candidatus Hydrogenedentota bacterium]